MPILNSRQSHDGFRFRLDLEDTIVISETFISRTRMHNISFEIARLGLKNAFDHILYLPILCALRAQGIIRFGSSTLRPPARESSAPRPPGGRD